MARAIDDAVVRAIAAQDAARARALSFGKVLVCAVGLAGFGVNEDGANLRVGLRLGEGPVSEDEIGLVLLHHAEAMTAGNTVTIGDFSFGQLAIGICGAGAESGGET
jgi:hypothetical protein